MRFRLAVKVILLVFITLFLGMAVTTFYVIRTERELLLREAYSKAEGINYRLFQSLVSIMALGLTEPDVIHKSIERMKRVEKIEGEEVLEVRLIHGPDIEKTFKNKNIKEWYRLSDDELPADDLERRALSGETVEVETLVSKDGKNIRVVKYVTPVRAEKECLSCHKAGEGDVLAAFSTAISLEPVYLTLRERTTTLIFLWGIGFTFIFIALFYVLQKVVIRPVLEVSETARAIAGEGDLSKRVRAAAADEIGERAASFNKMVEDLQRTTVGREYVDGILYSMLDTLIVVNRDAAIRTVNRATLNLLGYSEEELIGRHAGLVVEDEKLFGGDWYGRLLEGVPVAGLETMYRTRSGDRIPMILGVSLMKGGRHSGGGRETACLGAYNKGTGESAEKDAGVVIVAKDITELKRVEEELRENRSQSRELSHKLISMQEEERARLSRELHDQLGKQLTALSLETEWLSRQPAPNAAQVRTLAEMIENTTVEMRRICKGLRPTVLDDMGLAPALKALVREFEDMGGFKIESSISSVEQSELYPETAICVYRVFQEALTNAVKHSDAKNVFVSFRKEGLEVVLIVSDDGSGFSDYARVGNRGLGLMGMRERGALCGGTVEMGSQPGRGTTVTMRAPLREQEREDRV